MSWLATLSEGSQISCLKDSRVTPRLGSVTSRDLGAAGIEVLTGCFAKQVLKLRDELELKVDVLSLPVDICVQHALQGNSALQGALNVALKVLQDIEDYEASLRQQEIDMVGVPPLYMCSLCLSGSNAP